MAQVKSGHEEWYAEVPRSIRGPVIMGLVLFGVGFGGFGSWAATAPLAAAIIAPGSFVASGENKVVQHFEGGVIKELLVNEGDRVKIGQPLLHLDETAALAKERQVFLRVARLEAISARLRAEHEGKSLIEFPPIVTDNLDDTEIAPIVESQNLHFKTSFNKLQSEVNLLEQNIAALGFRSKGFEEQLQSVVQQRRLLNEELEAKADLFRKGLIRLPEMKALERAIADADGQAGRLRGEIGESGAQVVKFQRQVDQTRQAYRQAAVDELQGLETELDGLRQQLQEAKNVLNRVTINAPVSGTIVRMFYHTEGGVIQSGKSIMEILPADVPLLIEAQIPRADIDDVRVGQHANVRLVGLNQRTTPVLNGQVLYVSADSVMEPTGSVPGKEVYIARVSLPVSELARVKGFAPTPGMPAEVLVQTAERTFFAYLAKPIADTMSRAFTER